PFIDLMPPIGMKLTPRHYAYLKISEGCGHQCSFCIIPSLRGPLVSYPIGQVLDDAERLFQSGVKELMVISQDTGAYGLDKRYKTDFWGGRPVKGNVLGLVEQLDRLGRLYGAWVRLHYIYPYPHIDNLIPLMADAEDGGVVPYLDIPFQHAHPDVLRRMKRPASGEKHLERIRKWREICPDLTIRSSFIVGFPGETESEFEYLLDFLKEAQLDRVGCFTYSPVEGAAANSLPGALPESIKEERRERLMAVQEAVSLARMESKIRSTQRVIVDETVRGGAIARSMADAPEIDGIVHVSKPKGNRKKLVPGDMIDVLIDGADAHDLWGQWILD
ncbi:MAG: 30S ribosomal protein S12 methylthiotransferase RimO, partial [Oxalobacter sp.]|nr:30S ribosomal protein S12 methylthiotransferase RimO [Oxalobacter sp.]